MIKSKIYSVVKRSGKIPPNFRKALVERRRVADSMIEEADNILSSPRFHAREALREAHKQKQAGIKLLALC